MYPPPSYNRVIEGSDFAALRMFETVYGRVIFGGPGSKNRAKYGQARVGVIRRETPSPRQAVLCEANTD